MNTGMGHCMHYNKIGNGWKPIKKLLSYLNCIAQHGLYCIGSGNMQQMNIWQQTLYKIITKCCITTCTSNVFVICTINMYICHSVKPHTRAHTDDQVLQKAHHRNFSYQSGISSRLRDTWEKKKPVCFFLSTSGL